MINKIMVIDFLVSYLDFFIALAWLGLLIVIFPSVFRNYVWAEKKANEKTG